MTDLKPPIPYEDITHTPASVLLELSHEELRSQIKEAEELSEKAQTIVFWLKGISIEKTLRENPEITDIGGDL